MQAAPATPTCWKEIVADIGKRPSARVVAINASGAAGTWR